MTTAPKEFTVTYDPHPLDAVLACHTRVYAKNFRTPTADDMLKSRAIPDAAIRLHKLFVRAANR